ncbi:MAG: hypothetical protein EHM59_21455 [Betaproteobacteria bacterium]|nr:MAG: hypothetical protein EHM59_21455 [Betaproteobacteria bacterium]
MSASPTDFDDEAWVSVESRASLAQARRLCDSVERLFRINPYLEIQSWQERDADGCRVSLRNLSNGQAQTLVFRVSRPAEDKILLSYETGLKRESRIELEPFEHGSRVKITDDYSGRPVTERHARVSEVDHSLTAWGHALRGYLERERRFGRIALWRWFLDRVWLRMKPSARRISVVVTLLTLAELVLVVLVALVYWLESSALS